MKIYQYVRFSTDEQKKGDSERRQTEKGKKWAVTNKTSIEKVFFDRGVSAFKGDNRTFGQFAELLKIVKSGDAILIENQDRFGRDEGAMDGLRAISLMGINVIFLDSSNSPINKDNFYDLNVFLPNILQQLLAVQESKKKSERLGETWAKKRKATANGVIMSRQAPGWLDVDRINNHFSKNNKTHIVTRIFESFAAGKSIRMIARELNKDNIPPFGKGKQNRGNGWSSTHLKRMLRSRTVIGEYQPRTCRNRQKPTPDGEPVPNYYPQIISVELFYKCQEILRRNVAGRGTKTNVTNLFTGLVKCAHCGGSLNIKDGTKGKYVYTLLRCCRATRNAGCSHKQTIQYEHVERAVLTVLWSKIMPQMAEENQRADKHAANVAILKETEIGIKNLYDALEKNGIDDEISNRLSHLKNKKAILTQEIEMLKAVVGQNPVSVWKPCPPTVENRLRLQNLLKGEIKCLEIDAGGRKARLSLNEPASTFQMEWNYHKANAHKKNPADSGFIFDETENLSYVDQILVWQTEENKKHGFSWDSDVEPSLNCYVEASI